MSRKVENMNFLQLDFLMWLPGGLIGGHILPIHLSKALFIMSTFSIKFNFIKFNLFLARIISDK